MKFGLKACKPARKPQLTPPPLMKKKRLSFAKARRSWTSEDWGKVLFSDECSAQQFSVRVQHVWRPSGERYHEKYTVSTVKHPPSQMVWGAMSASGTGGLYFLTPGTTMNGEKYVKVLQVKLQLHMTVHQCDIFIHDVELFRSFWRKISDNWTGLETVQT